MPVCRSHVRLNCAVSKVKAKPQEPRETECLAALAALAKFSELIASASDDEKYNTIIAKILQTSMQHGVAVALDGAASEQDTENLAQIRTWLASIASHYSGQKQHGGLH